MWNMNEYVSHLLKWLLLACFTDKLTRKEATNTKLCNSPLIPALTRWFLLLRSTHH